MTFPEYQTASREFASYPDPGNNFVYPTLGLAGEAGEVANKVQKVFRDDQGVMSDAARSKISVELGDVLWYLTNLATELKLDMEKIAQQNIAKLRSRQERGSIGGSGDNR